MAAFLQNADPYAKDLQAQTNSARQPQTQIGDRAIR